MMKDLLWAESQKLHRSKILWIAGFATVMVGLIVFAQGQFTFYDRRYIDGAGWFMTAAQSLATFYVLPAVIALLGSYMICREEQEDTLKSLRLIPVDEVKLTLAKMILAFVFSVLIYLLLFAITFLVEAVLHLEALSVGLVLENLKIYFLDGVGVFFAISPIIALVARMKKGYWLALVFAEIYSFAGLFASMSQQLKMVYPMTAATSYEVLTAVPAGFTVTVHSYANGWSCVTWGDTTGYISNSLINGLPTANGGKGGSSSGSPAGTSWYGGHDYSNVYDYSYYRSQNADLRAAFGNDANAYLQHFVNYGMAEGRQGRASFNVYTYRDEHPELWEKFGDNLRGYYLWACGIPQ